MLKFTRVLHNYGILLIFILYMSKNAYSQNLIFPEPNIFNFNFNNINNISAINEFNLNFNNNKLNTNIEKFSGRKVVYNDTLCSAQLEKITEQLLAIVFEQKIPDFWFLQLFDSWGKIPAGILMGHLRELGNYDECLKYQFTFDDDSTGSFNGQYCTSVIPLDFFEKVFNVSLEIASGPFPSLMGLQLGVCFPDTCTQERIDEFWLSMLKLIATALKKEYDTNSTLIHSCNTNKEIEYNTADYIAFIVFILVGLFMVLSSVYDYIMRQLKQKPHDLLIAFSVITNGERLFKISTHKSPNTIECLNGIRCLSIIWVVLGHAYATFGSISLINGVDSLHWFTSVFSVFIQFGTVSVDTFLFLSGLLIIWSAFREMEKSNGRLNILMMYVHRYLRLTPALAAAVLFCVSFIKYFGSGPFWHQTTNSLITTCEDTWWATLLYIQNYYLGSKPTIGQSLCIPQSWYLAVDTQLYILSPLVLIPLWKWGYKIVLPIIVLALLSNGCVFTTFMNWDFSTIKSKDMLFTMDRMRLTYMPTHARYAPWLIGVLVGFMMYRSKNNKLRIPKVLVLLGWLISISIILCVVVAPYNRIRPDGGAPTKVESAFYEAFSRTAWAVALGWLVFACHNGFGGIINSMLSWSIWEPFSRLTYSIYIVHFIFQFMVAGTTKHDKFFSDFDVIYKFWSDLGFTLSISLLLALGFESPIIGIEKVLFGRGNTQKSHNKEVINDVLPSTSQNLDDYGTKESNSNKRI